ncbi:hypothetical protein DPM19_11310 [Actinomadura craniellae]|uniref:Cardiolipin synthase N-terminal domain-containing protein n=1 Tax=Actinomadura craniellae TaxID=2231787 RepID=A0A365H843_9ACTN|nr:PLDc N-terminal domain-containing protein [Actinomadura craniellae]RAY15290.1 hypothetical protein DPM19_11310 [Actinomadura craniellae]
MLYALLALIVLATWLYCLFDVMTTDEREVRLLPKFGWLLVVLLGLHIGSAAWLLFGRPRREVVERPSGPPPEAPRGPDDDPDFLRSLDRRIQDED